MPTVLRPKIHRREVPRRAHIANPHRGIRKGLRPRRLVLEPQVKCTRLVGRADADHVRLGSLHGFTVAFAVEDFGVAGGGLGDLEALVPVGIGGGVDEHVFVRVELDLNGIGIGDGRHAVMVSICFGFCLTGEDMKTYMAHVDN